jgi:hypothetical protein
MRKTLAVLGFIVVVGTSALGSSLGSFMAAYSQGNLHTLIGTNVIESIKLIGAEPDSYDYYASEQRIVTYVDPTPSTGISVSSLTLIWSLSSGSGAVIDQIRLSFTGTPTPAEVLDLLGYPVSSLQPPASGTTRLGNVPYYSLEYTKNNALPNWQGNLTVPVKLGFLLNHLDDSVYALLVMK